MPKGEFIGKNLPSSVAMMTYYTPQSDTADTDKNQTENKEDAVDGKNKEKQKLKIEVVVYDQHWDTVRNFKASPKAGWNRFYWRLNRNGIRYPSRNKQKKDEDPASGGWVLPGKYYLTATYKGISDTSEVIIHRDPRVDVDMDDLIERQKSLKEFERMISNLTDSHQRLLDAKDDLRGIKGLKNSLSDSTRLKLMKLVKRATGKLDSLEGFILAPEDQKGIHDRSIYLLSKIWQTRSLLKASEGLPGGNAQNAIAKLSTQIESVEQQIDDFFNSEWIQFKNEIDALNIPILRDHQKNE